MTEPHYLIDTNVCIYVLADADSPAVKRLADCAPGAAVASAITYAEVMLGLARSGRNGMERARALFERIPVIPFDQQAASVYARLPFRRGSYDRLIAAHAIALGLTLVTSNVRDFQDIPELMIENWARP